MRRDTLLDFFDDLASTSGTFLVYDDGFRTRTWTYAEVARGARAFAARLHAAGITRGDKIVLWGENRPEWIVAFWGAMLQGVALVPIDFRASADFLLRVRAVVDARLALVGDDVALPADSGLTVWPLRELSVAATGAHTPGTPAAATPATATPAPAPAPRASKDDVVEIIFTSGATAEPKGVMITHRNILANIVPIEREILKYRRYARPFQPIRFLNLLPLSHMFGQAMATFIPPMLAGEVIFMRSYNPQEIVREIKAHRVSVLVSVPKLLDVLREHVMRRFPEAGMAVTEGTTEKVHWLRRWWRYRAVHRAFGWKFWAAVVGAAPLDPALEEYWGHLGFLVIQGYGLTETAPIVTLNHPFSAQKGSVGKPIAGVEVKIADDGEILVRGENVTTGYYGAPEATAEAFQDGWLHTGDIGGIDEGGRVFIRGRKKEMIVTPEGLNVFPEDVERALTEIPGVRDAAVVGRSWQGEERVHAVLVLEPEPQTVQQPGAATAADAEAIVRRANATLADHQKIRSHAVWPSAELPRTEGTRKLKRREIRQWVDAGGSPDAIVRSGQRDEPIEAIVARFAKSRPSVSRETTLEELALSSLERVELLMAIEDRFQTTIDEAAYAEVKTVGDLERLVAEVSPTLDERPAHGQMHGPGPAPEHTHDLRRERARELAAEQPPERAPSHGDADARQHEHRDAATAADVGATAHAGAGAGPDSGGRTAARREARGEPVVFPSWNRTAPARALRRVSLPTWILPLARLFAWIRVEGLEHLAPLDGPVVFAANHQSHLDAPAILWALPARWRYRVAIAMAKEFFTPHFFPERYGRKAWFTNSLNYYLASLFFNAFPLPQREAGTRQTLRYIGDLVSGGWSVLIFPEGKRTERGEIGAFRPGIGMIGARLGVPVVPVRLVRLDQVLHHSWKMAKPGPASVIFGPPLTLVGDDYAALAQQVENAVRQLAAEPAADAAAGPENRAPAAR